MGKIFCLLMLSSYVINLKGQTITARPDVCNSSASIDVPCGPWGSCHCEVRNVIAAVCEATHCSGNRDGCKCYGYCGGLLPRTSVCCCPSEGPQGSRDTEKYEEIIFEKIFTLNKEEIEVFPEFKGDSSLFYFYGINDPSKDFFVGIDLANHILNINSKSRKIKKENVCLWTKYLPDKNYLFYLTKDHLKDTILALHVFDINSFEDRILVHLREDPLLLSSPFSVYHDKVCIKDKNKIIIFDISKSEKIREFHFSLPLNIKMVYSWQNPGYFLSYTTEKIYIFFNSLPYVIILDTFLNIVKAYDFYEYKGMKEILWNIEEEYQKRREKGCCDTKLSISQCFTVSMDKVIWTFGNLCILFEKGEPVKEIVFKTPVMDNLINVVPFYISDITSSDEILLNFGGLNFVYIKKERF